MSKKYSFRDGPLRDGAPTRVEYDLAEMDDLTESPWDNPDGTPADQSSADIQYTAGKVGFGVTPLYDVHVAGDRVYAKSFDASGGSASAYIQRSNDGVGNFHEYWNTEGGSSSPVRLSTGRALNREFTANSDWYQLRGAGNGAIGSAIIWTASHNWNMATGQHWFGQYGQGAFDSATPARILGVSSSGVVIEVDPATLGGTDCPDPMTRAALLALAGSYETGCHYQVTDYSRGTVGSSVLQLHAVDANTLSNNVSVFTTHDNMAWRGVYDIHTNRLQELFDNLSNRVKGQDAVDTFPWGVALVSQNTVNNAVLNYTSGTVQLNTFESGADITITGGTFSFNTVSHAAQVTIEAGSVQRNIIGNQSGLIVKSGDFMENVIFSDANVSSETTGDVDNCEFGSLSIIKVSGNANVDAVTVKHNSNLTISGGALGDTTIAEDADITLYGGSNYENHFGASTVFKQVAGSTAYIRYTTIEGTSTWTNGNVNLSNVQSYNSKVNTTGSAGTISNSTFNAAYLPNAQRIASLTITNYTMEGYAQLLANDAARVYLYRGSSRGGARVLVSSGATLNASYVDLSSYGYVRVTKGVLNCNYTEISGSGYVSNTSTGTNAVAYVEVSSRGNIRFLSTVNSCRVYYTTVTGNGTIYHNGNSSGCYVYYASATGNGSIYSNNSVGMRCYYAAASANGKIYSNSNTGTHYQYYCAALSAGLIEMRACTGSRQYSVTASSQSIVRLQNSTGTGRLYYSSVTAYYYLYLTLTGTRSALHAHGRRTNTITNPANGTVVENF